MDNQDLEVGQETVGSTASDGDKLIVLPDFHAANAEASQGVAPGSPSPSGPPLERLTGLRERLLAQASAKWSEASPRVLDAARRVVKLCSLSLMLIFVVLLASWFMALSHWFTVVLGHFVLRHILPEYIDDAFRKAQLDNTMIFAAVGAFIVNSPPFIIFLLSFPLTFDRTVLEGSAAPANEFLKRITPKNKYALVFLKYAPRLSAGPIGCAIFWAIDGGDHSHVEVLDPLHAAMAGVAGEVVLTAFGLLKGRYLRKRQDATSVDTTKGEELLPTSKPTD
ncbi:hypothetical protein GY45DRAFT_1357807 [Cubamyces sp. BRFM 1775]|nr:hypothetical protein GY45DRAFT_1357807 [Cubamyces sp. BRFM 1775]